MGLHPDPGAVIYAADGYHIITFYVQDSLGTIVSDSVTVVIGDPAKILPFYM